MKPAVILFIIVSTVLAIAALVYVLADTLMARKSATHAPDGGAEEFVPDPKPPKG